MTADPQPPAAARPGVEDYAWAGAVVGALEASYIVADVALKSNDITLIRRALTAIHGEIADLLPELVPVCRTGTAAAAAAAILRDMRDRDQARRRL